MGCFWSQTTFPPHPTPSHPPHLMSLFITLRFQVPDPMCLPWSVCSIFPRPGETEWFIFVPECCWAERGWSVVRGGRVEVGWEELGSCLWVIISKNNFKKSDLFLLFLSQKQFRNDQDSQPCLCFPRLSLLTKQRPGILIDTITVKLALLDSRWI